mmetsp:Transcript_11719/g.13560  ORF Transcript_11719/g.13560 Transcript_11719/m.13560 type:complete len:461 (+) Transcript_11719:217-1599(+)
MQQITHVVTSYCKNRTMSGKESHEEVFKRVDALEGVTGNLEQLLTKLDKNFDMVLKQQAGMEKSMVEMKVAVDKLCYENEKGRLLRGESLEKFALEAENACGVNPNAMRSNQLLGESGEKKIIDTEMKRERKRKQALGSQLYTVYCLVFAGLMALSFIGKIPITPFEQDNLDRWTPAYYKDQARAFGETMYIPFMFSCLYIVVIFGIQSFLKSRKPFNLRNPLALWSLAIGIFSLVGSLRTVPVLTKLIATRGFGDVVCGDTRSDWLFGAEGAGLWAVWFIYSKIPELIDTLFIVLRKRKLITLHWYHHITVMTFCWHSAATLCINGIFYAAMNLTVHAFMYIFYFLAALGYRPTSFAMYITIIQILQMFAGTAITTYVIYHKKFISPQPLLENFGSLEWNVNPDVTFDDSPQCKVNSTNAIAGFAMYLSYLWLFCVFFYYAYLNPKKKATAVDKAKKTN